MMATMLGCDRIKAGSANVVIVGGMESMSKAPYVLEKARLGYRMGHSEIKDSMFVDGLEDAYETGKLMGCFADATALRYGLTREAQDDYAKLSMTRALEAQRNGSFAAEIVPVVIKDKARGDVVVNTDESPDETKVAKLSKLKAVFNPSDSGTVTAGNSSSIADGAASLILMTGAECDRRGIKPLARIVAYTSHSQEPAWFTTAPAAAVHKLLALAGWSLGDVDLFEVNEAFAAVALACINELGLSVDRVNVHGGACAMGHPIGASGARIIVTLIYALMRHDKTRGVATLCIGGGEATAIAIERVV
jgi:acetyl-CoA C-acetyltransferase